MKIDGGVGGERLCAGETTTTTAAALTRKHNELEASAARRSLHFLLKFMRTPQQRPKQSE
jgi:hypothetical protein